MTDVQAPLNAYAQEEIQHNIDSIRQLCKLFVSVSAQLVALGKQTRVQSRFKKRELPFPPQVALLNAAHTSRHTSC